MTPRRQDGCQCWYQGCGKRSCAQGRAVCRTAPRRGPATLWFAVRLACGEVSRCVASNPNEVSRCAASNLSEVCKCCHSYAGSSLSLRSYEASCWTRRRAVGPWPVPCNSRCRAAKAAAVAPGAARSAQRLRNPSGTGAVNHISFAAQQSWFHETPLFGAFYFDLVVLVVPSSYCSPSGSCWPSLEE